MIVPTVMAPRARYRGPGEPHKINLFRNQLLYDMTRLHQAAGDLHDDMVEELPISGSDELLRRLARLESHVRHLIQARHT